MVDTASLIAPIALIFGWQSAIAVVLMTTVAVRLLGRRWHLDGGSEDRPLAVLGVTLMPVAAVVYCAWGWLHRQDWFPSDMASPITVLVWAGGLMAAPIWLPGRSTASRERAAFFGGGEDVDEDDNDDDGDNNDGDNNDEDDDDEDDDDGDDRNDRFKFKRQSTETKNRPNDHDD